MKGLVFERGLQRGEQQKLNKLFDGDEFFLFYFGAQFNNNCSSSIDTVKAKEKKEDGKKN